MFITANLDKVEGTAQVATLADAEKPRDELIPPVTTAHVLSIAYSPKGDVVAAATEGRGPADRPEDEEGDPAAGGEAGECACGRVLPGREAASRRVRGGGVGPVPEDQAGGSGVGPTTGKRIKDLR